jgi:flagellar biogenesis protein FliO
MPMTRSTKFCPWNLFVFLLGMVLGVCSIQAFGVSSAFADVNPSFYDQGQNGKSNPSSASQTMSLPDEAPTPSPGVFSTLIRVIVALAVTLGLILTTIWGLKWLWEKRGWNQWADEGKAIRVLATTYLSPQKAIYLLEVGKRILVVGVGGDKMNCLDIIREPEEVEALRGATQQGFPKVFNRVMQNHETADQEAETKRILEESKQVVGGYVAKLRDIKKKKNNPGSMGEEK